jgi:nucleoside-diphosphate-sugar epimerase
LQAVSDVVALTGGTGFIGRRLISRLRADGIAMRALARRPGTARLGPGVEMVAGDLEDERALRDLVSGASVVIHAAGVVSAGRLDAYHRINALGTAAVTRAMLASQSPGRLVLVSSLAARSPEVSAYARSKREGEEIVLESAEALEAAIVRPPAVYGPGDRATLPIFAGIARGLLVVPGARRTRFSLLYVDDLADLLAGLVARPPAPGTIVEPDDGTGGGYGWRDVVLIAQEVLGRRVRLIDPPHALIWAIAIGCEIVARARSGAPFLSREKLGELSHEDWVAAGAAAAGVSWSPRVRFADGLRASLAWYRQAGWL